MNFVAGLFDKVTRFYNWFSDNSNGRAVIKRKRSSIEINENISPSKRRKLLHSYTQTECFGGGPFLQFSTRTDKIQSMIGVPNEVRTFYSPSSKTHLRPPQSWGIKMDAIEFSSDDDSNDVQVLEEVTPRRSRNPLVSIPVLNGSSSSAADNNGVQVLEFKKKGKNIRLNGSPGRTSFHTSTPAAPNSSIMHRKMSQNCKNDVSSVKNHSIDKPRVHALNMSIQMESKQKYGALLNSIFQQSAPPSSSFANLQDFEKKVQRSYKPKHSSFNKKVSYIDLTESKEKRRHNYFPVQPNRDDGDSDVEVISVKPVPRVNSYEEKVNSCKFMLPDWVTVLQSSWDSLKEDTARRSKEQEIKKNLYAKRNKEQLDAVEERVRRYMTITDTVVLDEQIEEEDGKLPELTSDMEDRISAALNPRPPNEVIAEGFSLKITRKDMHTLAKLNWLNDEVINFYMNLLIERGKKEKMPKVYAFNTFFYPTLIARGYSSLKRWTRKVDIFAHDLIVVPVHLGVHWCVAIVDFREKVVEYYDSMGHPNNKCLSALLKYLQDESMDKKNTSYDISSWNTKNMTDIPQQMNGSDCGMFACTFAEYKCRNGKINFTQEDMPYFRRKMVYEILTGRLLISND